MTTRELQKVIKEKNEVLKQNEEYINENKKLKAQLEAEKNKPKEYIEKTIDNTDYKSIEKLKKELEEKEIELLKNNNKRALLERDLELYKKGSEEYKQFQRELEALTKTKEDLGRQIDGIKQVAKLFGEIDILLTNKLAPIKYSKAILDCQGEEIVIKKFIWNSEYGTRLVL